MSTRQHRRPGGTSPLTPPALKPSGEALSVGDGGPAAEPEKPKRGGARREGRTAFSTYLPADVHREFKAQCALHDIEIQQGVEEAIRMWMDRNRL